MLHICAPEPSGAHRFGGLLDSHQLSQNIRVGNGQIARGRRTLHLNSLLLAATAGVHNEIGRQNEQNRPLMRELRLFAVGYQSEALFGAAPVVLISPQSNPRDRFTAAIVAMTNPNWNAKPCVIRPEPDAYGPRTRLAGERSGSSRWLGA